MRTRKCAAIVSFCLSLIMFAILFLDWIFLAIIIPFLIFLFIGVLTFRDMEWNIEVSHSLSTSRIFESNTVEVNVHLKNNGKEISFLEIFDMLPSAVQVQKNSNYAILHLKSGEELTMSYELKCPLRGQFQIGPLILQKNHLQP